MIVRQSRAVTTRSAIEFLLTLLALATALWIVCTTVNISRSGWVPVPVVDDWNRWVTYVNRPSTAAWLFAQHYDHRLVAPKLLFLLDDWAFHSRGWFLLVCSFLFQASTLTMLWRLAGCSYPQGRGERLVQAAILAGWMFSAEQWINFVFPFQVQFLMVYTAAAGMLFAIWKSAQRKWQASWMIASILLGAIAVLSMANGILIFPVALLAGFWMRMPLRWLAAVALSGLLIGIAYFSGWKAALPPPMHLPHAMAFGLGQLGAPAVGLPHVAENEKAVYFFVLLPAAVLALGLLSVLILLFRRRDRYNGAFATLAFYGVFLLGTTALVVYGRSTGTLAEAFQNRYFTPAYLFWGCMLLVAWPLLRRASRAVLYAALCAFTLAAVAMNQAHALETVEWWSDIVRLGQTAVADNVADPFPWSKLYDHPDPTVETLTHTAVQYLRAQQLSLFADEWARWPGTSLKSRFSMDPNPGACEGVFSQTVTIRTPFQPGWRVGGWAWDKKAASPPHYVILAGRDGTIAGVALTGLIAPPELAVFSPRYKAAAWRGYVAGEIRELTAYALESDGRSLCEFDRQTLPGSIEKTFPALGLLLQPTVLAQSSPAWVRDAYFKGPGGPGAPPSDGPVYGTFPGNHTGAIHYGPYRLGWNASIAVPFVTGPDSRHVSILVRDTDTKEVFAKLDPVPAAMSWSVWHPDLPADRDLNLEIVAETSSPNEWLALGWPHLYHRL